MVDPQTPDCPAPRGTSFAAPFSIIIPAHNEASVIERCLKAILADAPGDPLDLIVVCNGCTDETGALARTVSPRVKVIEVDKGSKPLALNTGNKAAIHDIRLFVDADILVSFAALTATAAALRQPGIMAASPALKIDLTGCGWMVRAYYKVWMRLPYVLDNMVGSGVFSLSSEAMAVVQEFPPIIADDEFIRTRFASSQRCLVRADTQGNPVFFTVFPPRNIISLIRIESRQRAGLFDLHRLYPSPETQQRMTTWPTLLATMRQGCTPLDLIIYLAAKASGRLHFLTSRLRGKEQRWLRDESSRRKEAV